MIFTTTPPPKKKKKGKKYEPHQNPDVRYCSEATALSQMARESTSCGANVLTRHPISSRIEIEFLS